MITVTVYQILVELRWNYGDNLLNALNSAAAWNYHASSQSPQIPQPPPDQVRGDPQD